MTCEEFIRNNRGINDGADLPQATSLTITSAAHWSLWPPTRVQAQSILPAMHAMCQ